MTAVTSLKDKTQSQTILTIDWLPGTDQLVGTCFCGASQASEDPIELWTWLLAHPDGHTPGSEDRRATPEQGVSPDLALTH